MPKLKKNKAFSIVEMLAFIVIFTFITLYVLVGYSKFSGGSFIKKGTKGARLSVCVNYGKKHSNAY